MRQAVTGGGFFYIALADMVQSLHSLRGWSQTVVQSVCIALGVALMAALVYIEDALLAPSGGGGGDAR